MQIEILTRYGSGSSGYPTPQKRNIEEQKRLAHWLNDDWDSPFAGRGMTKRLWEKYRLGQLTWSEIAHVPDYDYFDDLEFIAKNFLPRLKRVTLREDASKSPRQIGIEVMKQSPGVYRDEKEAFAFCEETRSSDRAWLSKALSKYKIVPTIPTRDRPAALGIKGPTLPNATRTWVVFLLLQMAADGVLDRLAQCDCGCGKWFIKRRGIDRFVTAACSVRYHQADETFKEKRRIGARKLYRAQIDGNF
jgi:hypothetical protein